MQGKDLKEFVQKILNASSRMQALQESLEATKQIVTKSISERERDIKKFENNPTAWLKANIDSTSNLNQEDWKEVNNQKELFKRVAYLGLFRTRNHLNLLEYCNKLAKISFYDASSIFRWISQLMQNDGKSSLATIISEITDLGHSINTLSNITPLHGSQLEQMKQTIQSYEQNVKQRANPGWYLLVNNDLRELMLLIYTSRMQLLVTDLKFKLYHKELFEISEDTQLAESAVNDFKKYIVDFMPSIFQNLANSIGNLLSNKEDESDQTHDNNNSNSAKKSL